MQHYEPVFNQTNTTNKVKNILEINEHASNKMDAAHKV
jgi:hypothetical protein